MPSIDRQGSRTGIVVFPIENSKTISIFLGIGRI